jgi:threonine dehydratase
LPGVTTTLASTLADVRDAATRIAPWAHRTPVLTSASLDRLLDAELWFKCENLQKAGAFKFRGAMNAVSRLSQEELARGVATHSSGNHAAALALAAQLRGARAYIVMPRTAREVKKRAVAGYGGEISFCAPTLEARETTLQRVIAERGCVAIHPYNHPDILAGQGTAALELLEEVPDLDTLIAPVGGGGLLSGTAIAGTEIRPGLRVLGAEPAGADDAYRSLQAGRILPSVDPRTVADGLLTSLGELTFAVLRERVESIVTVSEQAILAAMRLVWERMKIIIEPSSAVPVAALYEKRDQVRGRRIGVILSGGNVDLDDLPWAGHDE